MVVIDVDDGRSEERADDADARRRKAHAQQYVVSRGNVIK